ncbi:protein phosphatase 2C domain-containing protein [Actinopolymorpha sp. B11F2]|uniref:PP2C family protein-serine/threonine phosphatase n=1 Tax=Actinopolymorpha sp. B11F2 TaxID=3160862 RepID=UPI0032E4F676
MRFTYAAESHVGHVRDINEDSGFAGPHLLLVADGVGGAPAGEVASASVAFVMSAISLTPRGSLRAAPSDLLAVLRESVQYAFWQLREGVATDPERAGMATTLTAILTDGERFGLAHIGNSRASLLRRGQLSQLTTDHTFVQFLVDEGRITPEQVRDHPFQSVITRSVSATDEHEPDLALLDLQAGDRVLLCSDGLTDLVSDNDIGSCLTRTPRTGAVQGLIRSALEAGGRDNVTCVVGDVDSRPLLPWTRRCYYCRMVGALPQLGNLIDPAVPRAA